MCSLKSLSFRLFVFSVMLVCVDAFGQDQKPPAPQLFPIKIDGKWGFIDTEGHLRIPAIYSDVGEFSEGLAPVSMDELWGFVDGSGKWVVQPLFERAENFRDGFAPVKIDDKWGFIGLEATAFRTHNSTKSCALFTGPLRS